MPGLRLWLGSFDILRTRRAMALILALILGGLTSGCGLGRYSGLSGVHLLAPRGHPPADSILWSKTDGNLILVNASEVGFGFQLEGSRVFIMDWSGGQNRLVASTDKETITGQTWSPDNSKVVLEIPPHAAGYQQNTGLWIWSSENNSLEYLADNGYAIWSPQGARVAIIEYSKTSSDATLHLIDLATKKEEVQVIGSSDVVGIVSSGDWSPDGKQLILSMGDIISSIPTNLYTYDIAAHQLIRVTSAGGTSSAVWSPAGDRIAYIRHDPATGKDTVHILRIDGGCDVTLPYIDWVLSISWSPNGKKLAFVGPDAIYSVDLRTFAMKYLGSKSCLPF